jgi:multimeric flavodoxin WrbA
MKILNIYGSTPGGSSATIADRLIDILSRHGADIQSFTLKGSALTPCSKCLSCKTGSEKCIINDDISGMLDAIRATDVLILSTGVYVFDVTDELLIFESRTFSFLNPDYQTNPRSSRLNPDKKLVFIQAQGNDDLVHDDIYKRYDKLFKRYGFTEIYVILADLVRFPSDLSDRKDITKCIEETARKIMEFS